MVAALLTGILSVIVEVNRDTRWFALILLFFLIALEAIYTTNWLHHPRQMPLDRNRYRGAELLLLFVVVRIASWIVFAEGIPDSAELEQYLRSPHTLFLNVPFLITLLLAAITWRLAVLLAQIFNQLEVSDHELHFHSLPAAERKARVEDRPIQTGRVELVKDYTRYWLWGGILLAFAVGVSTLEQQSAETIMGPLAAGRADQLAADRACGYRSHLFAHRFDLRTRRTGWPLDLWAPHPGQCHYLPPDFAICIAADAVCRRNPAGIRASAPHAGSTDTHAR
jgi:hypothetical protein